MVWENSPDFDCSCGVASLNVLGLTLITPCRVWPFACARQCVVGTRRVPRMLGDGRVYPLPPPGFIHVSSIAEQMQ
jgi:hypothetical protein